VVSRGEVVVKRGFGAWQWRGYSLPAVGAIVLLVLISTAPQFAGYVVHPSHLFFTGVTVDSEDGAQHATWAAEMAMHLGYQNVLTPEAEPVGWFFSPLEFGLGLVQRATGVPYFLLLNALLVVAAPALALALMALARRAGFVHTGAVAAIALLAGSYAPLTSQLMRVGLMVGDDGKAGTLEIGTDATPLLARSSLYLLLATLAALALASNDDSPVRRFRRAGAAVFAMAAVYPFFVPTLWLAAAFCGVLWMKRTGWRPMLPALAWFYALSAPVVLYWALLPRFDGEYARFAAADHQPLFSPVSVVVSLGLGSGAIFGLSRLLRGNRAQQVLGAIAVAVVLMLYVPPHPWRSHLFFLSPLLVIGALAAWWPLVRRLRPGPRLILAGALIGAAAISLPYYERRAIDGLSVFGPPTYLSADDVQAIQWLADQPGTDVVLARADLSPWVAAGALHRVVVGHYLWTHNYFRRRTEVQSVFDGGEDPVQLLRAEDVKWVLIDGERGVPKWADGVEPVTRFGQTSILRADDLLTHAAQDARADQ
jgi:hypothetical protein